MADLFLFNSVMFWADDNDKATKSIMTARMDGTGKRSLVTDEIRQPQGITVDPREGRWVNECVAITLLLHKTSFEIAFKFPSYIVFSYTVKPVF